MRDMVDKTYQIPYPTAGSDALYNRLKQIQAKEKIDVIIPNFDAELMNFIKLSDKLGAMGVHSFLPTLKQFEAREKVNLSAFCKELGINSPRDMIVLKADQIAMAAREFGFPMVVKGRFYEAAVVNSIEQAEKVFYTLIAKWGLPVIIQEFIAGIEINVAVLGDGKGNAASIVPMRKLYITDKGKAWAGITLDSKGCVKIAEQFIKKTKWRGGFELEIIKSSKNGRMYVVEINPRFPAWIYLSAAAGQNQPAALVKMALGQRIKPFKKACEAGTMFIRYSWDMITDLEEFNKISAHGEN
jgi:carbamoyl-phosphate synthase large subunit